MNRGINKLDADKDLQKEASKRVFAYDASLSERAYAVCIAVAMRMKRKVSFNCLKNHSPEDTNEDDLEVLNQSKNDWPPAVPILQQGVEFRGIVTHITDDGILHFLERDDSKIVDKMAKRMKEIVKSKKYNEFDWRAGDICFAKHPTNDKYCRGKIIHIDSTKSLYKVIENFHTYLSIACSNVKISIINYIFSIAYRYIT